MSSYAVERLLRPVVELDAALATSAAAFMCLAAPQYLMMTPEVSYLSSAGLMLASYPYWVNGIALKTYQRNIKVLRKYEVKAADIPVSQIKTFIGRGFRWQPRHTQRLFESTKLENENYVVPGKLYDRARRLEAQWESTFCLKYVAKMLRKDSVFNPVRPHPPIGGMPAIHGVGADEEEDVYWNNDERNAHALVLGTTRVGKTRMEEILVTGDIRRGNNCVVVIDPKGDGELFRRMYTEAVRAGRQDDFYFFHLGYPEVSCRYNPVGEFQRITEVAGKTTAQLADSGNSAAFKAFSWRFVNVVARALVFIGIRPTLDNINTYVQDLELLMYRYALKVLDKLVDDVDELIKTSELKVSPKDIMVERKGKTKRTVAIMRLFDELLPDDQLARQLALATQYERSFYEKLVASLLPFLDKLNTGPVAKLLSPEYFDETDTRPILSWKDIIQRKGIVYIGLDGMTDREVATAVGNAMFNDLVSNAGLLYKHGKDAGLPSLDGSKRIAMPTICLHADEFNSLVGDEFVPMVNQAGGAGVQVTAYTQTLQDLDAKFGTTKGNPKSMQIIGNFNTLYMLRVQNEDTAALLTSKLPKVTVKDISPRSGYVDQGVSEGLSFTSSNQDQVTEKEVPLIDPSCLMSLPKGQAFVVMNGNQVWKIRLPLLADNDDIKIPKHVADVCAGMNEKYSVDSDWLEAI
jgi:conjugative coupling factor TraD (TOL family)